MAAPVAAPVAAAPATTTAAQEDVMAS